MFEQRLARAQELLKVVRHMNLGTVNADGSPHGSPVFMAYDERLNFYWASSMQSQHSQNIARSGQVFITIFDSVGKGGGLYIQATASELSGDKFTQGLQAYNKIRQNFGREPLPASHYTQNEERLYQAVPENFWVNIATYDKNNQVISDRRQQLRAKDIQTLLGLSS